MVAEKRSVDQGLFINSIRWMYILPSGKQIVAPKSEPTIAFLKRQRKEPGTVTSRERDGKNITYEEEKKIFRFLNKS